MLVGFCGGVKKKVEKGDVVIFDSVSDWDYGKWYAEEVEGKADSEGANQRAKFYPRPNPISLTDRVQTSLRSYVTSTAVRETEHFGRAVASVSKGSRTEVDLTLGAAASGSSVVGSEEVVASIRQTNDNIRAIDMEAYGFYHACTHARVKRPEYFCIKAVADWANGAKDDEYHAICCEFSAKVLTDFVTTHWDFTAD